MTVIVRVDTNVSTSDVDEAFLIESTESLANTFKISKSDILIFVNADQPILIAGSEKPAAVLTIYSTDGINEVSNKLHSATLFSLLTKYLKVNEDRISIAFSAVEPYSMGVNGKTFVQ
ncbi:Macrophage migration inhibitory factor,Tautomerase/MIF superfamily [Cinara cedri]|uniref:L-dopachrome isomerase n=1 Tax=Cinara cedri TaxID=506608 RepID=A0A5E4M1H7_9HEMI|nr:Macrophage migration inhibitory factor,Tautomerase/MIF superfamily [Cinara cedri]